MTALISRQHDDDVFYLFLQHSQRRRLVQAAALLQMQAQTAASARRLPNQQPRQTRPSAAQLPPRGIQAESGPTRTHTHPVSSSSQDQQPTRRPSPIPWQLLLTQQLTKHWPQFKVLRQHYASTSFEEKHQLPQKHKATVLESSLCVEMNRPGGTSRQRQGQRPVLEAPLY